MNDLERKLKSWKQYDEARTAEQQNRAFLSQRLPKNPDWMYQRVKIRRTNERHGFLIDGREVQFGEVVSTTEIVARGLIQQGKAERVT